MEEFEKLKGQMMEFQQKVENQLNEKRFNLMGDKQNFIIQINDLKEQEAKRKDKISELQAREEKTKQTFKNSIESLEQQKSKVDQLNSKQAELIARKNELQSQIGELTGKIESTNKEFGQIQKNMEAQRKRDHPELVKFEQYLGLKMVAVSVDLIRFIFMNIDPNDFDRQFSIELDVSSELYIIGDSSPPLEPDIVHLLQEEFNTHKELVRFLKTARNLFRDLV